MQNIYKNDKLKFLIILTIRVFLFSSILMVVYGLFFHLFGSNHLFYYEGILVIAASFLMLFVILIFKDGNFKENISALFISTLLLYSFHATVPTILDRSISIQVIGSLNNKDLSIEELNKDFLKIYVDGYSTTCRRLDEQLVTGNVIIENGYARLTQKGKNMQKIFNFIAEFLKIEDRYIKGKLEGGYLHHYELINGACVNSKSE